MNEIRCTRGRRSSTAATDGEGAPAGARRAGAAALVVLSALGVSGGMPSAHGEGWERARQAEATPVLSVPFGSAAAAEIPQVRGTAIRPILQGVMSPPNGALVSVSGHPMRLAPGVTIHDSHNRIVLPGTLQAPVPVRFTLDHLGHIQKVRIMPES